MDDARLRLHTAAGVSAETSLTRLPGGGTRLRVEPPPGVPAVASLLTLASPPGEALYGLGARRDRFDQRGPLGNVWVEQQNAGDERAEPVTGPDYTFPNGAQAAYFVQPALIGSRAWAAWTGGSALGRLDLAASRAYTADTGRAPAPLRHPHPRRNPQSVQPRLPHLRPGVGRGSCPCRLRTILTSRPAP